MSASLLCCRSPRCSQTRSGAPPLGSQSPARASPRPSGCARSSPLARCHNNSLCRSSIAGSPSFAGNFASRAQPLLFLRWRSSGEPRARQSFGAAANDDHQRSDRPAARGRSAVGRRAEESRCEGRSKIVFRRDSRVFRCRCGRKRGSKCAGIRREAVARGARCSFVKIATAARRRLRSGAREFDSIIVSL